MVVLLAVVLLAVVLLVGCEEATETAQDTQRPTAARLVGQWQIEGYETGEVEPGRHYSHL